MYCSAYDIKAFYTSRLGRIVRRVMQERIQAFWPDVHGLRVMGYGYSVPYMRMFMDGAERVFNVMPSYMGVHPWPHDGKNLVCLADETQMPLETSSVDRILLIHALEFSEQMPATLQEMYRILKPNGRMLVIVPNRAGLWAHAESTPMGQGTPYSLTQICTYLKGNMFIQERTEEALFMPPYKSTMLMKSAGMFERYGQTLLPFAAGLHMVEASKQIYARPSIPSGNKAPVTTGRGRALGGMRPASAYNGSRCKTAK